MIKPTVGRVVYYKPDSTSLMDSSMEETVDGQPLRADIIAVHSDVSVNLSVTDSVGQTHVRIGVFFAHNTADETTPDGGYAYWMPYQLGQAAKTEAVQAEAIKPRKTFVPNVTTAVTPHHIAELLERVEWKYEQPVGTTATFAHAFLDGTYYLASGFSACVSPENFDANKGMQYAQQQAAPKVADKLWELEGYLLRARLSGDEFDTLTHQPEFVARVAHEVNRAYCAALGDHSQPAWRDAPQWQKDSAMMGVALHTDHPDADAAASHDSWRAQKIADGWTYGPNKDPANKKHPCIVRFEELSVEQQAKDFIFRGVVHALVHDKL